MYIHFFVLGLAAACVMAGFLYRIAAPVLFLGFTYFFLLEQTRYLNHFYLVCLISFLMCFLPAERAFSIDALLRRKIRSEERRVGKERRCREWWWHLEQINTGVERDEGRRV